MGISDDAPENVLAPVDALVAGKGRPRSVDRETVVAAARALLQEQGVAGVTIRRVAERVGIGVATVHNAAGSKQDLLLAVIDDVLSELPHVAEEDDPWEGLRALWISVHELLIAHPAVAQLASLQPVAGEGVQRLVVATTELLQSVGLDEARASAGYQTLRGYTLGFTLLQISRAPEDETDLPHAPTRMFEFEQGLDIVLRGLRDLVSEHARS